MKHRRRPTHGTASLIRLNLRLDRFRLPIWLGALIGLVSASAFAVQDFYGSPAEIALYKNTIGKSTASIAMNGPPLGLDTVGGITAFEVGTTAFIGTALMAIFLTIRHTRADEESGRTELVLAAVVNRKSPVVAAGIVVGVACAIVGIGITVAMASAGLDLGRAALFGAAVAMNGLAFTAIALVSAQLTVHGRGATGIALAVLAISFLLRAMGDAFGNWLSWLSPIGWSQQVGAFGPARPWPLLISGAFTLGCLGLARFLAFRRDFAAGLIAPKPGRAYASPRLSGTFGLAARLQRGVLVGWMIAALALGIAYGSLGREVQKLVDGNEQMEKFFANQGGNITDAYFNTVTVVGALILTGFVVSSVLRLRTDETALRAEPLLAASVPRLRWALTSLAVTVAGSVLLLTVYGLGMGVAQSITSGDRDWIADLLRQSIRYLPASLLVGGVTFAIFGWLPSAVMLGWGVLAGCAVIAWMGPLLQLPAWVMNVSPFQHPSAVPVLSAIVLVLLVVGLAGLRRRDLATG
ncbi:ABC transporter permease [Smaragdicoccus niigatensis]|uniref:ABC transporter permease n=1 Tax=Smaragdicoccus niigatensis TaxID=359359 RepID=UPI000375B1E5|nr:hypothetical protein [Smaragdicoccus niigatensis]